MLILTTSMFVYRNGLSRPEVREWALRKRGQDPEYEDSAIALKWYRDAPRKSPTSLEREPFQARDLAGAWCHHHAGPTLCHGSTVSPLDRASHPEPSQPRMPGCLFGPNPVDTSHSRLSARSRSTHSSQSYIFMTDRPRFSMCWPRSDLAPPIHCWKPQTRPASPFSQQQLSSSPFKLASTFVLGKWKSKSALAPVLALVHIRESPCSSTVWSMVFRSLMLLARMANIQSNPLICE